MVSTHPLDSQALWTFSLGNSPLQDHRNGPHSPPTNARGCADASRPWHLGGILAAAAAVWQACLFLHFWGYFKERLSTNNEICCLEMCFAKEALTGCTAGRQLCTDTPWALQKAWYCKLNFCWREQGSLLMHYATALISLRQKHYQLHSWLDIFSRHQNQTQHEFCYPDDVYNMILKGWEHLR